MNTTRRTLLKGALAAGTFVAGASLLSPRAVWAAWPKEAFDAKTVNDVLKALLGSDAAAESADITVKAPEIAENGSVVPITVTSTLAGVESIVLIAAANPSPLSCSFNLGKTAKPNLSTRIKLGKTGDVIAVVKAGGKLLSGKKAVKVTIGGCGG